MWSFWVEINVQLTSESLFLMEQIQKQVVSLKSSEVYLSIDINYAGMITKGNTWKINSVTRCAAGIQFVGPWLSEQSSLTYLCILSVIVDILQSEVSDIRYQDVSEWLYDHGS